MRKKVFTDNDRAMSVEIGQRLRDVRNAAGLSQSELGEQIGVTFQQIQKYEKGVNRVSVPKLIQICKVLDCAPTVFLDPYLDGPTVPGGPLLARLTVAESKLAKIRNLAA